MSLGLQPFHKLAVAFNAEQYWDRIIGEIEREWKVLIDILSKVAGKRETPKVQFEGVISA